MTKTSDPSSLTAEDARHYYEFSNSQFTRLYPVIADQILERTGITHGSCLDVGSGPASLAIAIALLSDLRVTALDSSPEMYALAHRNIRDRCMEGLVTPVLGDVHAIPAADSSFNLVISRGAFHSWYDLRTAFREIYRVLMPHGMAYVGGGYGNARIRDEVLAERNKRDPVDDRNHGAFSRFRKMHTEDIRASIESAGIGNYRIINDDSGLWILMQKPGEEQARARSLPGTIFSLSDQPVFHDGFFFTK